MEYKARSILEALYSMRDINLPVFVHKGDGSWDLRPHKLRLEACGGCRGKISITVSRQRGPAWENSWLTAYNFCYIPYIHLLRELVESSRRFNPLALWIMEIYVFVRKGYRCSAVHGHPRLHPFGPLSLTAESRNSTMNA